MKLGLGDEDLISEKEELILIELNVFFFFFFSSEYGYFYIDTKIVLHRDRSLESSSPLLRHSYFAIQ